jgi:CHASE1-domain containing sensor protein
MTSQDDPLISSLVELASIAGVVANVCDRAEHNERHAFEDVEASAARLRLLSVRLAQRYGRAAQELYARRIGSIERRNVVHSETAYDGERAARDAATWRELQLVQIAHDRFYHLDVVGLTKSDQLRHCALHLAKIAGATAGVLEGRVDLDDYLDRRVADVFLFGIKLATLSGQRLPSDAVEGASHAVSNGTAV